MAFHRFVEFIFKKDEKKAILQNKSNEQFWQQVERIHLLMKLYF